MSATPATAPVAPFDLGDRSPVPMTRLAKVEMRKALDTRAGFWFTLTILFLALIANVIVALADTGPVNRFEDYLGISGGVLGYFLPILIIMLVTAEASQRTGLVTFALEPKRVRVLVAKLIAAFALSLIVMAISVLFAILGTGLAGANGGTTEWGIDGQLVLNSFLVANVIVILVGFALATLLMNTPAAIVAYFVYTFIVPMVANILAALLDGFDKVLPWVEFNTAQMPLFTGNYTPSGEEWAQLATSCFIWLVIPLALGIRRLLRMEFK